MYFDPGTGSIIIQSILAFVATISMFFFTFRTKIVNFFKRKKGRKKDDK